jgi:hypothetical protein
MQRRQFLTTSLASAAAVATARSAEAQATTSGSREFYQIRQYHLQSGPQTKLTEAYFSEALIPALTRLGMGPIGAFKLDIGPETPTLYLLIPGASVEALVMADLNLVQDATFLKAADPFWNAPAIAPPFQRVESSLLSAFTGWPKLTLPPATATKAKCIFQLRTYESATPQDHVRKVEMFNSGEFEIFKTAGFSPVFFGDTLIGPRTPNLTYMLSLPGLEELNGLWKTFAADPAWKKLTSSPRYNFEEIVSNITNLILSPLSCSQI